MTFFILFCLLLRLNLIQKKKIIDQPILVFLQDNSTYCVKRSSAYYRNNYELFNFIKIENINVDVISFDNQVRNKIDFSGYLRIYHLL